MITLRRHIFELVLFVAIAFLAGLITGNLYVKDALESGEDIWHRGEFYTCEKMKSGY